MFEGTFLLFGATGDLSKRRIIPALYALVRDKKISNFFIVGAALEDITGSEVLQRSKQYIEHYDEQSWDIFESRFFYQKTDVTSLDDFKKLAHTIQNYEQAHKIIPNRLVYLALPPQFFSSVTEYLAAAGIIKKMNKQTDQPWYRVAYEKPFGFDHASAYALNKTISNYLKEFQIFRIDHYLAQDIVGTLALIRFTNRILEPLWNHENIAWVEVVLSETAGVEERGAFYDICGALKDVVQNHMLQIVALLAMETPEHLSGNFIRDQKAAILQKIEPVDGILGQYNGYKQEKNVPSHSTTETFAAIKLMINTPRWHGVPFYLKTGKCLTKKETVITIQFKPVACLLSAQCPSDANSLTIRVLPDPGFELMLNVKKPGVALEVMPITMDFCYECKFGTIPKNVYELLLKELLEGEQSISVRLDEIEYAWDIIDRLKKLALPLYEYQKGSHGPMQLETFEQKNKMR